MQIQYLSIHYPDRGLRKLREFEFVAILEISLEIFPSIIELKGMELFFSSQDAFLGCFRKPLRGREGSFIFQSFLDSI